MVLVLLMGTIWMARFQAKLREVPGDGDGSPFVYQQGADNQTNSTSYTETIWGERRQPTGPEPGVGTTKQEPQSPSPDAVNKDTLGTSSEPEDEQTTALVTMQSILLGQLYLPLGDAPVQNGYALSAKSATLGDWRAHLAVDFAAQSGAAAQAVAAGTVSKIVDNDPYWGTLVSIDHGGGWSTSYSNIDNPVVRVGERVAARQVIGQMKENPPLELLDSLHLHFVLLQNGQPLDPSSKWHE